MKPIVSIVLIAPLVVVAVVVLRPLLFPAEPAPDSLEGALDGRVAPQADAVRPEARQLEHMLIEARSLVGAARDEAALGEILTRARVDLQPEVAQAVLPVVQRHLEALRDNLQNAHRAATSPGAATDGVDYPALAARLHAQLLQSLRALVSEAQATAIFQACPAMVPPSLGRIPGTTPGGVPAPAPEPGTSWGGESK